MATILSKFAAGNLATINGDCAGDVFVNDYFIDLTAAQNVTGNIIDMGTLPFGCTVSDAILVMADLDTGAAMLVDVGIMSGTPGDAVSVRTCGAEIFSASTLGQTGGVARPTLASAFKIAATNVDRSIGVKIGTQAGTAAAGRIGVRVFMHATDPNVPF